MDLEAKYKLRNKQGFKEGYNEIVSFESNPEMLMTFGILHLDNGSEYENNDNLERIFIILQGEAEITWGDKNKIIKRDNVYDFDPITLHVPQNISVKIKSLKDNTEFSVHRTENEQYFEPKLINPDDITKELRGQGTMNETGTRLVRTILQYSNNDKSNFMIGEDVQFPGKWAGFPSHSHKQPEIYFYRFYPENGFGLLKLGDEGVSLEHNDTVIIEPDLVHPQVAAPGYAMYFLWVIRHLPGNPYIKPDFEEQHMWVSDKNAKIWPER